MGWNESVNKILRFIPAFERDVKAVTALAGELKEAIKRCEDVAEENRLLTLENQKLKSSNEVSLKALKDVQSSFKRLNEKVSAIESKEIELPLYDDTAINKRINDIVFPVFDDTELLERIGRFEGMFDSFRRTEGEQFALAISKVNKSLKDIKPYDDSKVLELIESLQSSLDSINEYDDTKLKEAVESAVSKVDNLAPYDDLAVKKAIKDIRTRLTKLTNEVKKHK